MKKILITVLLIIISTNTYAEEKAEVLLVPFKDLSEKKISFFKDSISEIITSKIKKDASIKIYDGKETKKERILANSKKENIDFVITGSIAIDSNKSYNLKGSLYSVKQNKNIVFLNKKGEGAGTIFVHINNFADKILEIGLKKEKEKSSFDQIKKNNNWKSKKLDFEITSINRCDYNGDGKFEIIISSPKNIYLYKKEKDTFKKILDFDPDTSFKVYGVEAADLNGNGRDEILVTALNREDNRLNSFIMEWGGKHFVKVLRNQNNHYRLVTLNGEKTLLTQEAGHTGPANYGFDGMDYSRDLYRLTWENGYKKIKIIKPSGTQIYSFITARINNDINNAVVSFDSEDHIKVSRNNNEIWRSGDEFGGSDKYFKIPSKHDLEFKEKVFFSQRLFFDDIDNDGNKELITVKNENQTSSLPNSRSFTKASIIVLSWGATGFDAKFKSSKYSGYISDFYVGDIDNDGKKEIVYAVVSKDGFFSGKKSFIYTYNLY